MKLRLCLAALLSAAYLAFAEEALLKQTGTIPLPGVSGRIDHMTVDLTGRRLFVCALGNNTVEVLDLSEGNHVRSLTGLDEPQGVLFLPDSNRLIIASGGDGSCRAFDGKTFEPAGCLDFQADADNLRLGPAAGQFCVGHGHGAISIVDADFKKAGTIPLSGHPESFRIENSTFRIFVNVPSAKQIAVIDLKKQTVVDTWKLPDAESNFPMALDEANHILFVGCRRPAKLIGIDTQSGCTVFDQPIDADTDDIFVDAQNHRIYVSCGGGFVDVFAQTAETGYQPAARIPTAAGARTSLFVPETQQLFLAVPHRDKQEAEIRIYSVQK